MSAPGGGGCGIPACTEADTPLLTESQMPVKTLPCPNFVAGGKHESTESLNCNQSGSIKRSITSFNGGLPL